MFKNQIEKEKHINELQSKALGELLQSINKNLCVFYDLYKSIENIIAELKEQSQWIIEYDMYEKLIMIKIGFNNLFLNLDGSENHDYAIHFSCQLPKRTIKSIKKQVKKYQINYSFNIEIEPIKETYDIFLNLTIDLPKRISFNFTKINNYKKLYMLLLLARYSDKSLFHKDIFPLDMFKIIYYMCTDISSNLFEGVEK